MKENDAVREIFKESGFTKNDIYDNKELLKSEIQKALDVWAKYGGLKMTIAKKERVAFIGGTRDIDFFEIRLDGPYFKDRQCVTFERDGFVGFAGWASTENTVPILDGFCKCLEIMKSRATPE